MQKVLMHKVLMQKVLMHKVLRQKVVMHTVLVQTRHVAQGGPNAQYG